MDAPAEIDLPLVPVPASLLWDWPEAPADPLWRLNRIASRFPAVGTDRATVAALVLALPYLKLPYETRILIGMYEDAWQAKLTTR